MSSSHVLTAIVAAASVGLLMACSSPTFNNGTGGEGGAGTSSSTSTTNSSGAGASTGSTGTTGGPCKLGTSKIGDCTL
jgi:hypothetical protein